MRKVSLSTIAQIVRGVTFDATQSIDAPKKDYLPILRAGNIQDVLLLNSGLIWVPSNKVSNEQILRSHDIVMCASSGSPLVVGKCAVVEKDWKGSFGAFCVVIRPDPCLCNPSYLAHFLRSPSFRKWASNSSGVGIKNIRKSELESFKIPLPPLPEQKRIAQILDNADTIRRKREQAIDLCDSFLRSVFLDMFGDPVTNPKGWEIVPLSSFVEGLEGGKNFKTDDSPHERTRFYILKVSAVTWGKYDHSESKPVPEMFEPPSHYFVKTGDLLMSRANTRELIGATAYVRATPNNIILPDKIWRFLWRNESEVSPVFVHWLFKHPKIQGELGKRSSGTSGSMKNISQLKVLSLKVPFPPIDLQKQFEKVVITAWNFCDKMEISRVESEHIIDCLVNNLLSPR